MKINHPSQAKCWFLLHPYVFSAVKKDRAILYNTLAHSLLEYTRESPVYKVIKRLTDDNNNYVIQLKANEIDGEVGEFISRARQQFFGDLVDCSLSTKKPVQLKPILNLQHTLQELTITGEKTRGLVHDEIPDYLDVLTLYLNDECSHSCSICSDGYKQFACCFKKTARHHQLTIDAIAALFKEINNSNMHKLNIMGGNLLAYPELEKLAGYLNRVNILKVYHLHYLNLENRRDFFNLLQAGHNQLVITIHFPADATVLKEKIEIALAAFNEAKPAFQWVIQQAEDMNTAGTIMQTYNLADSRFIPFYNGSNRQFFRDHVFTDRASITGSRPGMKEILLRTVLNSAAFKKLTILSDQSVYANLYHPAIGKLGKRHMMDMIYTELHKGKSWPRVRQHVSPCRGCAFNALCPPISHYEYAIGQYNLCHIFSPSAKS